MSENIKRSEDFILVSLFLSKFGEASEGKSTYPPIELNTSKWKQAYACFYNALGEGRTTASFKNSLKNSRDVYDSHHSSGRSGWRAGGEGRPPAKLPKLHQDLWDKYSNFDRLQLWQEIKHLCDLSVASLSTKQIEDVDTQRGEVGCQKVTTEGKVKVIVSAKVERNIGLRSRAFKIHGYKCAVCDWDFGSIYGEWGEGFAEVHHLDPLGETPGERETDPKSDLAVLCANCHRMVHRKKGTALTIKELKSKLDLKALKLWASRLES